MTAAPQKVINPWLIAVSVMFATFMEVLDTTVVNVSLPHIASTMSATTDEATWALTSYLVANAIILPMTGWLASRLGRKRLLMWSTTGFTLASFLCGAAPNLTSLVIFRILQGATGGALQPLSSGEELDDLSVLMVDAGEHTLDWLLIQQGAINPRASGAASDAGRHRVVRAVLESLAADIGRPLGPAVLPRINEALRLKKEVKLSGVAYDLTRYEPVIMSVVEDSINRMVDGLRDAHEIIDLMVLVGGQPDRYRDVLKRRFPAIPVFVMPEPLSANVRGFQLIGEALADEA